MSPPHAKLEKKLKNKIPPMISNLEPLAGTQPQLPLVRPVGDEFQIGEYLIRRFHGEFIIWNADGEMLQTDSAKIESELREFFDDEF